MRIYDVSVPIGPDLPVWPGDPAPRVERVKRIEHGDGVNVTALSTGVHTGTHVDAPLHFLRDGAPVEALDPKVLMGPARVVDVGDVRRIDADVLDGLDPGGELTRLLLRTSNSALWDEGPRFEPDFSALDPSGARWVVERGIRLVGIDYLSIQRFDEKGAETHRVLLQAGVVILEGLRLDKVRPGAYGLVCLPLLLPGAEGAPARALLVDTEEGNPTE